MIKRFLVRVGIFFSLPFIALFGFLVYNVGYKTREDIKSLGYWTGLNDMMNDIYDEWANCLEEC